MMQTLGISEQASTLLLDKKLKNEYDTLLRETADAKSEIVNRN